MNNFKILILVILVLGGVQINAQVYNEEDIRQQLDQYIANPKLYYDKIQEINAKADKSNENTLKISEEYLALLDKKDSLINLYKKKLAKAAPAPSTPTTATTQTVTTAPVATTKIAPTAPALKPNTVSKPAVSLASTTPFRVQLAAFYRDDFSKFFGTFNKTIGVEKLDNRNVIEIQGFKDEAEAIEFSQKIKKLGFGGAFVTKYDENGKREESFAASKNGTKFGIGNEPTATAQTPIEYPNYIPSGYKEIKKGLVNPSPKATATSKPAPKAIDYPSQPPVGIKDTKTPLKNPTIMKSTIIASTPPAASPAPKTLATVTPPAPKSTPKRETNDQLDAAFDQLFKK